jgi:hypothetical protein
MTELEEAIVLASKILERPSADPDDDLAILARQFIRGREEHRQVIAEKDAEIERLKVMEALARESNKQACETSDKLEKAWREGQAEIARLKAAYEILGTIHKEMCSRVEQADAECRKLRELLMRAANALEYELDQQSPPHHASLISELREAMK